MKYRLEMALFKDTEPEEIATALEKAARQIRLFAPKADLAPLKNRDGYWALSNQRPVPGGFRMMHGIDS